MGFLDKQSRVIDFVLTERGRKLYSVGQLDFSYFGLFDDGIDYDAYSTSSLTYVERERGIQDTLMLEAPYVQDVMGADAPLEPVNHLFAAAQNYLVIPQMNSPVDGSELELRCLQSTKDGMFIREQSNVAQVEMAVHGETDGISSEYVIRLFSSGSNGLIELDPRRDLSGRISYDPFVSVSIDVDPTGNRRPR